MSLAVCEFMFHRASYAAKKTDILCISFSSPPTSQENPSHGRNYIYSSEVENSKLAELRCGHLRLPSIFKFEVGNHLILSPDEYDKT